MVTSPGPLPDAIRERIAMVRVLCIGFMIYVHVPDNAISAMNAAVAVPAGSVLFQGFLAEGVGRASAALLSLVSGLLTAGALARGTPLALYRRRFRSIIVPMVIWSTVMVAIYAALSLVRPTFLQLDGYTPAETLLFYLNTVFFLTDQPVGPTMHLGFLRDLFVCVLLSPLMVAVLRRIGVVLIVLLGVLYLLDAESVIVLRPLVVFAFAIGLWLARRGARLDRVDAAWPWWVALSILATLAVMLSGSERGLASAPALWAAERGLDLRESLVYPLSRLFGGLAIWTLAAKLVGSDWSRRLSRVSPYVFVAFCSHYLTLVVLWEGLVKPLVGSSAALSYVVWFAAAPFVAMFCAGLIVETLARLLPSLAALLTGGRVRPAAPPPPRGRSGVAVPVVEGRGAFVGPTARGRGARVEGEGARARVAET